MNATTHRAAARLLSSTIAALALVAIVAGSVAAASPAHGRITRGAVIAAFQARTTGGYVNLLGGRTIAAPVRGLVDGRINSFFDKTYCSTDWHYLGVTLLGEGGLQSATAYLRATSITFAIDGTPVSPAMRTAIKRFVGTGVHGQFGISVGALVAPGSLADGDHTLETLIHTPDFGDDPVLVTFNLSADACG